MDKSLESYFLKNSIAYKIHEHPAVFTVEESKKIKLEYTGKHTKSLFLKDDKGRYYLVCLCAEKRLDMKKMRIHLKVEKLHFGSPEELKEELNLTPGSVSIFGMIHAKTTSLILDKELWEAESVGFHPNINTATLEVSHESLKNFYDSLSCKKEILEIE